MPYIT